jgi:hypothetical protein
LQYAADQGSIEGKIEYAMSILHGDGMPATVHPRASQHYLRVPLLKVIQERNSLSEMIPLIFKTYSLECSL